jgi:transforming growth factor-beta-induced protein
VNTILERARDDPRLTSLVTLIYALGLTEAFAGEGPVTLFAPINKAFDDLYNKVSLLRLLDPEYLSQVLLYHLVSKRLTALDLASMDSASTGQGSLLRMRTCGDTIIVNEARVLVAEIEVSNGMIHVIDTVLMPESANVLR